MLLAMLAAPAAAQAQTPPPLTPAQGWIDDLPMYFVGGCLSFSGQPACWDGMPPTPGTSPRVGVAPGSTLTLRFGVPATAVTVPAGVGTLTQRDPHTWALTLAPSAVATFPLPVNATLAGDTHAGLAHFSATVAVTSPEVLDVERSGSVVRLRVRVPARGTVRAHVRVGDQRRSAVVERTFSAAGQRRLRVKLRGTPARSAWLVMRYTFPGGQPVEISQRLPA
ncbi:hypothetical protein DVA67_024620 [Solirubrobacter sp. CPCC 204708]|uniref:hypothetical protein n=1 Tax=Solirubrobacter deserti TaxID=2282478 RepID=UPI001930C3D1|nr:hypothetical protein [Solirubrobacter deserti]MBE2319183.1 hypothetical protein [Solirubrobacter deserti]